MLLFVSPTNVVHRPGCGHKDDSDLTGWQAISSTREAFWLLHEVEAGRARTCGTCRTTTSDPANGSTLTAEAAGLLRGV